MIRSSHKFVCPNCHGSLQYSPEQHTCRYCEERWDIHEVGIHDFAREEYWWNQIDPDDMLKLLDVAATEGWKSALYNELLPRTSDYTYRYALQESRADWHFLLSLNPETTILDIGCGWGAVTTSLARHYANVYGIDANLLTLKFLEARARQEGLTNINLARTDPLEWDDLPFEEDFFDAVVLNGVLEWIGSARYDQSPTYYQRSALKEIRRILKPKGVLYIGIENRFSYGNFLGNKAHNGVPFADILPRRLANLVSRWQGHEEGFRTYTYSLLGYKRLLSNCGFSIRNIYFPFPDYRFPDTLIPIYERKLMSSWSQTHLSGLKSSLFRLAVRFRIAPYFIYSYGIVFD